MSTDRDDTLPYHRAWIGDEEIAAVAETLRSGWLTMGPQTFRFEAEFAEFLGAPHAVAVNSCTAALMLALDLLEIGPGDEVITSSMTFTATAAVAVHRGAKPVLVDCTADTMNLDVERAIEAVSPRTRAIVPVHMAGHPCDMDEILALARRHNLAVIEDAAHALPASYRGRRIGTVGDFTAFSFYAGKNMTTGEGGMLTTARADWAAELRSRRLHGLSRDAWARHSAAGSWRYDVVYPGYKYNMTDLNAAIGLQQLVRLPAMQERRLALVGRYREGLADVAEIALPVARDYVESAWHVFVIRLDTERLSIGRDEVMAALKADGVMTSVTFIPLHLHSYYRNRFGYRPEDFPNATALADSIISLPLYPRMEPGDVDRVCDALRRVVSAHRR
jgi:perosamine synthetase